MGSETHHAPAVFLSRLHTILFPVFPVKQHCNFSTKLENLSKAKMNELKLVWKRGHIKMLPHPFWLTEQSPVSKIVSQSTSALVFLQADVSNHEERAEQQRNRKWNSICSVCPLHLLLAEFSVNQGKGGLTLHACHQASAFKSRFNAWEKEIHFYPLYWESIQRVMANLLDCHGNHWEKWFLSVSLCVSRCWRGCIVRLYRSTTGQNAALQCSLSSLL